MPGRGARYRFVLVEEPESTLPVRYRRTRPFGPPPVWVRRTGPLEALLEAFFALNRRGEGAAAWAPALAENPLAFLLDAVGDAITLRMREGDLVYANPAARRLGALSLGAAPPGASLEVLVLDDQRYERRCMTFTAGPATMVLEVLRRLD